ncbi:MAG: hypothetical protein AVDCRST_MAG15-653, partial [uncultured Rubellimicrobium sp.]
CGGNLVARSRRRQGAAPGHMEVACGNRVSAMHAGPPAPTLS